MITNIEVVIVLNFILILLVVVCVYLYAYNTIGKNRSQKQYLIIRHKLKRLKLKVCQFSSRYNHHQIHKEYSPYKIYYKHIKSPPICQKLVSENKIW